MVNSRCGDRRHLNGPHIKPHPCQRTSKCFACDVVPMRMRFTVSQHRQSICKPDRAKMMDVAVHDGSQTDPAIAWRSKTDQIRFPAQFTLCHMVIRHLTRDQCPPHAIARKDDQLQI
jgi:hypothetical protein